MNRYELHVQNWSSCQRCFLHERRRNTCLARGDIPCDVFFCGEAPGKSEDVDGEPFVGPTGQMLDNDLDPPGMIQQALRMGGMAQGSLKLLFGNLLACIPLDDDDKKVSEPPDECVETCKPRLVELVEMARPRLIVCVGKDAESWLEQGYKHSHRLPLLPDGSRIPQVKITHPSAIMQAPMAARGLMTKRNVVVLKDAFLKLIGD